MPRYRGNVEQRKAAQGFSFDPRCCGNCKNQEPAIEGVHPRFWVPGVVKAEPARCQLGDFVVEDFSVCDEWRSKE